MSFLRRLLGLDPEELPASAPPAAPIATSAEAKERPEDDPELRLERLGEVPLEPHDEEEVLGLIERLREGGREARAVDLARRILAHEALAAGAAGTAHEHAKIHFRVAEILSSRGDDDGAYALISGLADGPSAPLDLVMLAAEIDERRGDSTQALARYERILARDLDYPRAAARVRRLREGDRKPADLGATLMADGALTRGRYRVERELGRGGAGTVFLAEDLALTRKVALKVYHRRGRAERARLLAEARMPARFQDPGVVRIFDLDESLAAISMERVLGGSVRTELTKGSLSLARIRRWLTTCAEALMRVHAGGIVHRDVKPSNMLLRSDDRVVLTDFGLASEVGEGAVTHVGEGTLIYMPPEQKQGLPAATSMDVYALGVTMLEILEHASSAPPLELAELAQACRRKNPVDRPTMRALFEAFVAL